MSDNADTTKPQTFLPPDQLVKLHEDNAEVESSKKLPDATPKATPFLTPEQLYQSVALEGSNVQFLPPEQQTQQNEIYAKSRVEVPDYSKAQQLAAEYQNKDINQLDPGHQKLMGTWEPQDLYELKQLRPDYAMPTDQQRKVWEADEAGELKHPSVSEGLAETAKNFTKGALKFNDALSVWSSPVRTLSNLAASKLFAAGAGTPQEEANRLALEASQDRSEAAGNFIHGALKAKLNGASYTDAIEAGRQSAAATGAPVAPEVAIRSYIAPTLELPGALAWTGEKMAAGGLGVTDWALKKASALTGTTDEDRFRRWQARELVDTANATLNRAHPTVYGQMVFHPWVQEGLKSLIHSTAPGLNDEEVTRAAQEVAGQVEKEQGSVDKDIREFGTWTNPVGGFGEIGFAGDLLTVARNAKPLFRAMTMSKEAQQALEASELAKRVVDRSKLSGFGKIAGKTADLIDNLQEAASNFAENYPRLAKLGAPIVKYSPGAIIGAHEDKENPVLGALGGIVTEAAGLKGIKLAAAVPRTLEELSLARSISAGGKKGMFQTAGETPEVSKLTQNLFEKHGRTIDALGNLLLDYGKEGVNMAALGAATGVLNSQNYDDIMEGAKSGLLFAALGKTYHKILRQDPATITRKLRQQDVDNFKTMSEMSPETVDHVKGFVSFDNVIAKAQSDVDVAKAAYASAVSSGDQKQAKLSADRLDQAQKQLDAVSQANVATRQAYERQLLNLLTAFHNDINGSMRVGPKNAKIEILNSDQIREQLKKNNPNLTPDQIDAIVEGGHFTAGISRQGFIPGKDLPAALRPDGSKVVFDPLNPTAVINVDHLMEEAHQKRQSLYEAMRHEFGHLLDVVPEWRELNADAEEGLFDDPLTGRTGQFSNKALVEMYTNKYLKEVKDPKQWAINRGHWDELHDRLDEGKVADYMKREVRADLNSQAYTNRNLDSLDSFGQHMMDWLSLKAQNSKGYRAIQDFLGAGGKDPYSNTLSVATGAKFSPEVLAAYRNALREFRKLNGMVSSPTASESVMPMITRAKLAARKDLREKYGKDSGLFKTEFRATVYDKDGNVVSHGVVSDPMASEGLWGKENGALNQRSGYGNAPAEVAGMQVPEGGTIKVSREIVMKADGETPEMLSQREIKQIVKTRAQLIRDALDNAYKGEPEGFRPVSEDGLTYRGNFTPEQIAALRALPEQIVPAKIKDVILRFNDLLQSGEGRRMIIDYAARIDDRGRAVSFAPKIYDLVPIGMHFSKEGNFLITCISVSRIFDKMNLWADRLSGRLALWGGSREAFFQQFITDYLPNHLKQWVDPTLPPEEREKEENLVARKGETGLDPDPKVAKQKKDIFNDFLNLTSNEFRGNNPDRTVIPRRKGDPRGKDANRTIMSVRADAVADMLESSAHPIPVNYELQKLNFLPSRDGEQPAIRPQEEEKPNPILKGLGAAKATYVQPDQRTPYAQPTRAANQDVQRVSKDYVEGASMPYNPHGQAVPVNEELAKRIADHYEEAKNEPTNPEVKKAYTALANEVVDQWKAFQKAGYTATPWTGEGQPYSNSAEMMKDVRDNKHLYYFQTKEGYGESGITPKMRAENPMLQDSGVNFNGAENVPVNDVFRVVHDIVGHGAHGYEFGPKGEFNAYLEHSRMFSDAAKPALAAETLAQNSWVNYGPHLRDEEGNIAKKGEKGYVPVTERPFAEQKNIALPQEFIDAAEKEAQAGTKQGPSFLPAKITREIGENEKFLNQPKEEEAKAALDSSKQPKFGAARGLKKGYPVALRIDIPAFNRTGNYVVTVHEKGTPSKVGEVIGYDTVARVDNPTFVSNETGAGKIYRGESKKFPIATVTGDFNPSREIPKDINDWTPVGFDPKEHSYFYDKATDEPVTGGDEAVSVGNTVFVKNPVYGDRANVSFLPAKGETKPVPTQEELDKMKARLPKYSVTSSDNSEFGTHHIYLFDDKGKNIGSAEVKLHEYGNALEIVHTIVSEGLRGKGYGEALYREIAKYAQEEGADVLLGSPVSENALKVRNKLFETEFGPRAEYGNAAESKVSPFISYLPAKKLTVQHSSEEKEGSVGGELDLVHFGASGLKVADPKKFGKGAATPMDLRGAPKTYFYLNNDRNYEGLMKGRMPYVAKVDGNSIYDLSKDPLGVAGMMNREKMDNMIEDAGYAGYFSPKSYNGAFDAIAMFKKTKLTEVQQGREIFKTPKKSKEFGIQYLPAKKMDEAHAKAIESGNTEEAQRLVDEAAKKAGYSTNLLHHGTTHNFTVFKKDRANIENDLGAGFYFSSSPEDAQANYAGEGPDLTNRIERRKEQIENDIYDIKTVSSLRDFLKQHGADESIIEDSVGYASDAEKAAAAKEIARKELSGGEQKMLKTYVHLKNPAILGGKAETRLEMEHPYDEEGEPLDEEPTGTLIDFIDGLKEASQNFEDADADKAAAMLMEQANYESINLSDAINFLKGRETGINYATDNEENLASSEIIRQALQNAGFDGVIDKTVKRFKMKGVGDDTYHVIAFEPEQIKSADPATYDDQGNLIPLSQRFNPESPDVRYLPAKKGVDGVTETEETIPTDERQPESYTQAQGAGLQAGGQSEDDRNRLLGGLASVARGAQSSGAEGVQGASGTAPRKEVEEAALRKHAEENGMMRDPDEFFRQWQNDGSEAGGEHQVSFPPGPDVVKRTPNPYYPTWADYFDSLQIHNTLFPKAALTFRGFQNVEGSGGVDIDGNKWPAGLYSEVSQPFLKIKRGLTVPETDALMKEIGFRRTLPMEYVNDDLGIKIKDLHGMNAVMLEDENGKEFPYVIDSTIVPTKTKEEQPRVDLQGHVIVNNPEADFVAKPKILVNFLPASQRINLEDYEDTPMFALPADRMGIGTKYVGPTGDKKKLSVEAQGGPEHMTLLNHGVWAFSNEGPASTFANRVDKLAEKHGTDSVLVAVTLQSPINHLRNPTGQLGYVEAMEQARDTKHLTQKQLDAQIKEMSASIVASKDKKMDEGIRSKWKQITSFGKFADAVRGKKLNFGDMEPFLKQMQRASLPISAKELQGLGLLPHDIARDLSTDWIFDLPNDTVVGLFEVKKGTRPLQDNTHYSYPWSVAGKPIGFLKDIYHIKGLTTHPGILKSTSLAWPLQRALPELDNLKKALADLKPVVTYR